MYHEGKMMRTTLRHIDVGHYNDVEGLSSFEKISKTRNNDKKIDTKKQKVNLRIDKRTLYYDN